MNNQYIYLIFTKTGTWLSRLIGVFSNIKYAHASISFDNSFTRMYSFGRTNPDNPFSGGFVEENLYEGVYKRSASCECMIYRIEVTAEQYSTLQQLIEQFAACKEQLRYNFLGLFGALFNKPLGRKNYYFCSQFVSEVLMKSNIFRYDKSPELIKTDELYDIENKEIIYEGFLMKKNPTTLLHAFEG